MALILVSLLLPRTADAASVGVDSPVTAQWLVLGALKNQGMSPVFQSGRIEMLHERMDLKAEQKRGRLTENHTEYIEAMLAHHREQGASDEELERRRLEMEQDMAGHVDDIVAQLSRRVTYERCLFDGNSLRLDYDTKTRIDRIKVRDLEVSLSDIPKEGLGVVVTENSGKPDSVCAGFGYGLGAEEAYLQEAEFFPRPQEFGRVHGVWTFSLSHELMDDPEAFDFSFEGEKAQKWLEASATDGPARGLRIVREEALESAQVYVVEAAILGKVACNVWIAPALGFAVPRIEVYEHRGEPALSPTPTPSLVMECSNFIHLDDPDIWFPLQTKYTRYDPDGTPATVDIYNALGPQYVEFNLDLDEDAFRIPFKRRMRLEDSRRDALNGPQYYDGFREDLRLLPSELAALVDQQDPRIVGGGG